MVMRKTKMKVSGAILTKATKLLSSLRYTLCAIRSLLSPLCGNLINRTFFSPQFLVPIFLHQISCTCFLATRGVATFCMSSFFASSMLARSLDSCSCSPRSVPQCNHFPSLYFFLKQCNLHARDLVHSYTATYYVKCSWIVNVFRDRQRTACV